MRATEFIRGLLDLIDNIDDTENQVTDYEDETVDPTQGTQYSNSPDTQVTPTDTLLSMGNDVNKPKHPADIRVSTVALYPNTAYKGE